MGARYPAERYFKDFLKERNDFGLSHFMDLHVATENTLNLKQIGSFMIRNRTPDYKSESSVTISSDKALYKAALTGLAYNTNLTIMVP